MPTEKSGADMADAHAHAKPDHDYHIIDPSPWPFLGSVGAFIMAIGGVAWMQQLKGGALPLFGIEPGQSLDLLHRPGDRALHHVRLVVGHDQGSA